MATYIKTLKDVNGDVVLPRTRVEAITMGDGTTQLSDHLIEFADDGIGTPSIVPIDADLLEGHDAQYFTDYADTAVANLVNSAPSTLDTLNELAQALGDDPNFATTVTNQIALKANKSLAAVDTLKASDWVGTSAPYSITKTLAGVTSTSVQEFLPAVGITAAELEQLQAANIIDGGQSTGSITLLAYGDKPTINIPIRIIRRGDI